MQEELWEVGTYLNPGNSGFAEMLKSDYVDKTGLIRLMNSRLGTKQKYLCVSRPRRFGKSYANKNKEQGVRLVHVGDKLLYEGTI